MNAFFASLWLRWIITFLGFPIGGGLAYLLVRTADTPLKGALGGLVTGAVLGLIQWLVLRSRMPINPVWIAATAFGLALGLAVAIALVGSAIDVRSLVIRAVIVGLMVGVAQAFVLTHHSQLAWVWTLTVAGSWVIGWLVTWAARVDLSFNWTVFGSTGAIIFALITGFVLRLLL